MITSQYLANPKQDLPIKIPSDKYSATKTHSNFHSSAELSKIGINYKNVPEHITNSTSTEIFRERLTHDVLLKTFPHLI